MEALGIIASEQLIAGTGGGGENIIIDFANGVGLDQVVGDDADGFSYDPGTNLVAGLGLTNTDGNNDGSSFVLTGDALTAFLTGAAMVFELNTLDQMTRPGIFISAFDDPNYTTEYDVFEDDLNSTHTQLTDNAAIDDQSQPVFVVGPNKIATILSTSVIALSVNGTSGSSHTDQLTGTPVSALGVGVGNQTILAKITIMPGVTADELAALSA